MSAPRRLQHMRARVGFRRHMGACFSDWIQESGPRPGRGALEISYSRSACLALFAQLRSECCSFICCFKRCLCLVSLQWRSAVARSGGYSTFQRMALRLARPADNDHRRRAARGNGGGGAGRPVSISRASLGPPSRHGSPSRARRSHLTPSCMYRWIEAGRWGVKMSLQQTTVQTNNSTYTYRGPRN